MRQMTICINPLAFKFSKFTNLQSRFLQVRPLGPNGGWPRTLQGSMPRHGDVNRGLCSVLGAVCTWWCSQLDGFQTSDKRGSGREDEGMGPGMEDGGPAMKFKGFKRLFFLGMTKNYPGMWGLFHKS